MNDPSTPDTADTRGLPLISHAQPLFATPSTNGVTPYGDLVEPLGTYTTAFGIGNEPLGARTVPDTVVVVGQDCDCWVQKPLHALASPPLPFAEVQILAMHNSPLAHVFPPEQSRIPPQPSER